MSERTVPLGATSRPDGTVEFGLWAPRPKRVELVLGANPSEPRPMEATSNGHWTVEVAGASSGDRYRYRLDGERLRADPASRGQPEGVLGPSAVPDLEPFGWHDGAWRGVAREDLVIYELHVGTFSPEGTFAGVAARLGRLLDLGVTAIELMPVAEFPGVRNWGYDGVFPFAVQHSYGGTAGLRALVDAAHAAGLAVLVDVVYNHIGPEGNFLAEFAPYFTDGYRTPWGAALNFDGAGSDEVRRYFIESALDLVAGSHLDGIRVDAVHAIVDPTARPFLAELNEALRRWARSVPWPFHSVAESSLNDPRVVRPVEAGGLGFDATWNDDFHHAVHALLTGESEAYYADFGTAEHVRRAFAQGFVLDGGFSAYRGRRHGASAAGLSADRFVVCLQDHDQVGNRAYGERLTALVSPEAVRLAAALPTLSPFLPMLFMGEEYGETAPFLYFTDHAGAELADAVRAGRRLDAHARRTDREVDDPQASATFERSRLDERRRAKAPHRRIEELYRELLRTRRELRRSGPLAPVSVALEGPGRRTLTVRTASTRAWMVFRLDASAERSGSVAVPSGRWRRRIDSADERWGGPGAALPESVEGPGPTELDLGPWGFGVYEPFGEAG